MKRLLSVLVIALLLFSSFSQVQPATVNDGRDHSVTVGFGNSGEPEAFEDVDIP